MRSVLAAAAFLAMTGAAIAQTAPTAGTPTMSGVPMIEDATLMRSYRSLDAGMFKGTIAGGHMAQDLLGKNIVGPDGEEIAEVADLMIGPDDMVHRAVLDVGGFLGIGARSVAIDLEQLQPVAGGDEFRIGMTKEQLEALPPLEQKDGGWTLKR